jgi:hypothetical protein
MPPRSTRDTRLAVSLLGVLWALLASCSLQLVLRNLYKVYIEIASLLAMHYRGLDGGITWQDRGYYASGQRSSDPAAFVFPRNNAISWLQRRIAAPLFENQRGCALVDAGTFGRSPLPCLHSMDVLSRPWYKYSMLSSSLHVHLAPSL